MIDINLDKAREDYNALVFSLKMRNLLEKRELVYLHSAEYKLPRFHVIPKVHKNLWSSRPIIPSHSWITSRVSKVVDYTLQKIV